MRLYLSFIVLFTFIFFNFNGFSQSPDLINYQAVARDLSGNPLVSTAVSITYDIRQNSSTGTLVYSETHNLTTNQFGLFTAEIGGGTPVTGTFPGINWSTGLYYLQVTVNGDVMTATQLLSVPYALHANTATSGMPGANGHANLADSVAEPAGVNCANGGYLIHMGVDDNDNSTLEPLERDISYYICNGIDGATNNNDTSATNEIQTLSINGDTLFISGGNFVLLPNSGSLWQTNTPDIYFNTGDVGIGTSTPNRKLSVETSSLAGDGISINNSSTGNPGIEFQTLGNPRFVMGIDQSDNNKFKIGTTNLFTNTRFTISPLGDVGIGTANPVHRLTLTSTDSVLASFTGFNPNLSIVSIAATNPNAVAGAIILTGSDSGIIAIDPALKTFFLSNSTTDGHMAITADSTVGTYAKYVHHQGDVLLNQTDSIFNFSSGPNGVFHVNQGSFATDSLYVLGANPGNAGWLLSDDGFGQAVWTDPNALGLGGGLWTQGTGDIFNTTDSVGIGVANPSALFHVSGGGLGKPTALFEAGGFANATININHTGSNGSGIIFQNGGTFTSGITSSTSNVLTLTSDFVEVGNSPKTGIFNVSGNSSVTKPTILVHEPTTGFSRIKHTNGVANKYWIIEAGINALNPQSGYSIGYNNGVTTSLPFIVYGDNKVGINNLATPLASFHVMDINTTGNGMVTEGFSQPGLLVVARNNFASPNRGAVQNGDQIGKIVFPGHAGPSFGDGPQIIANATENYTSSANGSELVFRTIANGTTSDQDALILLNDGRVEIPVNLFIPTNAGANKVLTSDPLGNASWQTPANVSSPWILSGSEVHYNLGHVGVGMANPNHLLHIQDSSAIAGTVLTQIENNIGVPIMTVTNNGRMGLGVSNPVSSFNIIYNGNDAEAGLINYTQTSGTANGTGFYTAANTNGTGEIIGGGFFVNSSANSTKSAAISASNIAGSLLNIGIDTRVSGSNVSATHIGGVFNVSGGASHHALQLIDGSQGDGKVLTSDATGKTTWKENKIAFEAFMPGSITLSTPSTFATATPVNFTSEIFDDGSVFNAPISEFTAKVEGVYMIETSVVFVHQGGGEIVSTLGFIKNGNIANPIKVSSTTLSSPGQESSVTITATVKLGAGETIRVASIINNTGLILIRPAESNWFSGHLVYEN